MRLLVPTATLARHLQNSFAREGFVFRPRMVETLSRFIGDWVADLPQISEPAFYLVVEAAARRLNRPEFAAAIGQPGFCAALARTMGEFSSAGCDAARLASHLPETPLGPAFLAVYQEVDAELARRGVATRARRLEVAAERIARGGLPGIRTVLLEGFHALPDPEMVLAAALRRHAEVIVGEPCGPEMPPAIEVFAAASPEREADEIARRILEQAEQGRAFREMAVVVRAPETYRALLAATFDRFGIPARFYFEAALRDHPVVRYLAGTVDAMLSCWDWNATLAALRQAPHLVHSAAMDRFEFKLRERIPGRGLEGLRELAGQPSWLLDGPASIETSLEDCRGLAVAPREWAARLRGLRSLYRPPRAGDGVPHERARIWRGHAAALDAFEEALDAAAEALGAAPVPLEDYWRAFRSVLRLAPLRVPDDRRNAVHVLTAHEARQWRLPVIFICGMVEKQFPRLHRQDPFFPDAARRELAAAGIRVRTAAQFDEEERALFHAALSGATALAVLSYPRVDGRGERNLPSVFLDAVAAQVAEAPPVRPAPLAQPKGWRPPVAIRNPELLEAIAARTKAFSPTSLDAFLSCPYRFFNDHLLRLEPPPPRPTKRLDFLAQGNIVHETLAAWPGGDQAIEPYFERAFEKTCAELYVPPGYQTEALRRRMLEDLQRLAAAEGPRGVETRTEQPFQYELAPGVSIRGRIDRLEVLPENRALVVDYKYSGIQRVRDLVKAAESLQPPLYLLAVERAFELEPQGMQYCGLRNEVAWAGWEAPFPEAWIPDATARALDAAARIRAGEIAPLPANQDACRWCAGKDVCRYQAARTMTAEGA